jgi:hypothetical protein
MPDDYKLGILLPFCDSSMIVDPQQSPGWARYCYK